MCVCVSFMSYWAGAVWNGVCFAQGAGDGWRRGGGGVAGSVFVLINWLEMGYYGDGTGCAHSVLHASSLYTTHTTHFSFSFGQLHFHPFMCFLICADLNFGCSSGSRSNSTVPAFFPFLSLFGCCRWFAFLFFCLLPPLSIADVRPGNEVNDF